MATTLKAIPGGQTGAAVSGAEAPYEFAPTFEAALVYLICTDREVFALLGEKVRPKALGNATARLLVGAAQAVAKDLGEGPRSSAVVIQRLATQRNEGKVSNEDVQAALDYLDAVEDAGVPPANAVVQEAAATIRRREEQEVLQRAMATYAKRGDFREIAKAADAAARIGESTFSFGVQLRDGFFDDFEVAEKVSRLPTGCYELDSRLHGGLPRGYTLFLGREKAGKSMVLSSVAAEALWYGKTVAIATLELSPLLQQARVMANLLNTPIDALSHSGMNREAKARWKTIAGGLGDLRVRYFSPETTVKDITEWVERLTELHGKPVDLLVVDYVDLVGAGGKSKDDNAYVTQRIVNNHLRDHANSTGYVCISASQARRGQNKGSKDLDNDDAADSMHKVRIPDLVIALRMEADQKDLVDYYITASRTGGDRTGTGPLPVDRAVGRMFPVNRVEPW